MAYTLHDRLDLMKIMNNGKNMKLGDLIIDFG